MLFGSTISVWLFPSDSFVNILAFYLAYEINIRHMREKTALCLCILVAQCHNCHQCQTLLVFVHFFHLPSSRIVIVPSADADLNVCDFFPLCIRFFHPYLCRSIYTIFLLHLSRYIINLTIFMCSP